MGTGRHIPTVCHSPERGLGESRTLDSSLTPVPVCPHGAQDTGWSGAVSRCSAGYKETPLIWGARHVGNETGIWW